MKKIYPIPILFIYYEPFASGQTTHVLSLVKTLDPARFQVEVLLPERLTLPARQLAEAGAQVLPLPMGKTLWKPTAVQQLFRSVKTHRDGVVHVHSQEAALIARPMAKLAGARKIFYTPQTIDIRRKQFSRIYIQIERLLALLTDRIFSVNEADRLRLVSWGISPKKVVTVYNGVDLEANQPAEDPIEIRRALSLRDVGRVVMQIGRLSPQKSPLDFVEGAAIVLRQRADVQFVMIGDGPLFPVVQKRIQELGLESSIKLTGTLDNANQFIPAADILTLTSLWEGSPYSILEGMAWRKPIVCTAINGCPEMVLDQQTGLVVPPGNPRLWAQAVTNLLDQPKLAKSFGLAGRQRAEQLFALPKMARMIEDLYEQAAFSG